MRLLQKKKFILITLVMSLSLVLLFSQVVFTADGVKLSSSSESGEVGDKVAVTIKIDNAEDTTGGQFDLSFDADVVKPVPASTVEKVTKGAFLTAASGSNIDANLELAEGKLRVLWYTPYGDTAKAGDLCMIYFEILDEDLTTLVFSDIVMAPDGVVVAAPASGRIEGLEAVDELQKAIDAANKAIADLPDEITLADEAKVKDARDLVDKAKALGAKDADFEDLDILEAAEATIKMLKAIDAADKAILALPGVDKLTLDDKPDVVAARALVNKAKDLGATDDDFSYLHLLRAAENRIRELEEKEPTPPTGGMGYLVPAGMLVLLFGLVAYARRSRLASR